MKKNEFKIEELGYKTMKLEASPSLSAGEVGYLILGIRDAGQVQAVPPTMDYQHRGGARRNLYRAGNSLRHARRSAHRHAGARVAE